MPPGLVLDLKSHFNNTHCGNSQKENILENLFEVNCFQSDYNLGSGNIIWIINAEWEIKSLVGKI